MFKFIDNCENIGYKPIPFSVNYSNNIKTPYSKYFISSRSGDSVYYNGIKKNPKAIYKTLQGAFYNKEAVRKINKLIKDEKPSVLYALQVINTLSPSIFKAAKKKGLKVIHRISDFNIICPKSDLLKNEDICELCLNGNLKKGIENKCYHESKMASMIRCYSMIYHRRKKLYDYVDYFVTPTNFTRNKLIEAGFDKNKIVTIPTFIDSSKITPNYDTYNYLLFLGRLVPEKGAKYIVDAMKYLKKYQNLKLYITGNINDDTTNILKIIEDNNLQDKIVFTGFLKGKELENLISNSLAIICPAIWYENMPNTVLEAYAYGKPVIASNIGCFPELIDDGKTGYLFTPKDSKDLANKIIQLVTNEQYKLFGKNARLKVENEFNPNQHFDKLKSLFER